MPRQKEPITLHLTDDQRELIRGEFGEDMIEWEVDSPDALPAGKPPITADGRPQRGIIVLTKEQRAIIESATGRTCEYVKIENWPVDKYGGPPPDDRP